MTWWDRTKTPGPETPGKTKLLAVEDDARTREEIVQTFSALGLEASAVGSAEAALEALQKGFEPSVIIMDFSLPGMSGPRLYQTMAMHPVWKSVPVVGFTSQWNSGAPNPSVIAEWMTAATLLKRASEKPVGEVVSKPERTADGVPDELVIAVANALAKTGRTPPYLLAEAAKSAVARRPIR